MKIVPPHVDPLRIFIGYDAVESVAYHTLVQSIIEYSSVPVSITPVKLSMLPMYKRERDPRQSNEFSFSRFLTPYLAGYEGKALFMDCDMMFRDDPKKLFDLANDHYSVMCVKHDYRPRHCTKYLGAVQYDYPRKNWSSVMLFNCSHRDCHKLTPEFINTSSPETLHQMKWTDDVGELPIEWNHLVGECVSNNDAKIVHWTVGGPYFNEYKLTEFSSEWFKMRDKMVNCEQLDIPVVSENAG